MGAVFYFSPQDCTVLGFQHKRLQPHFDFPKFQKTDVHHINKLLWRYIFADITQKYHTLITVEEALAKVAAYTQPLGLQSVAVASAAGFVLAEDVKAPINMPPFPQSAMDGYALKFNNTSSFKLTNEIKAGDNHQPQLQPGEAMRIFTGAAVPQTADAVVRQEDTSVANGVLHVNPLPKHMANIRPMGEQIAAGEIALAAHQAIDAATVGYLAMLGITSVKVFRKPKISVLITGNELKPPGQPLQFGEIYESNGQMLKAALAKLGIDDIEIYHTQDNFETTKSQLQDLIGNSDVVLSSGGISVGDYDFVGKALAELGAEEIFYKVQQKPGKPLYFGKSGSTLVFALPGNPASALTGYYVYVVAALKRFMGHASGDLLRIPVKISHDYQRKGDRALFLRARITGNTVAILDGQSSAMLHAFTQANALVYMPIQNFEYRAGDEVECIILP